MSELEIGDVVLLKDEHFKYTFYITNILDDGSRSQWTDEKLAEIEELKFLEKKELQ